MKLLFRVPSFGCGDSTVAVKCSQIKLESEDWFQPLMFNNVFLFFPPCFHLYCGCAAHLQPQNAKSTLPCPLCMPRLTRLCTLNEWKQTEDRFTASPWELHDKNENIRNCVSWKYSFFISVLLLVVSFSTQCHSLLSFFKRHRFFKQTSILVSESAEQSACGLYPLLLF